MPNPIIPFVAAADERACVDWVAAVGTFTQQFCHLPLCQTSCRLLFSRWMIRRSDKHEPKNTFPRIQRTSVTQVA